ncbi:BAX inhibitor (BI)-1/YccA family protein, partial [Fusobacterium mortiferum]|nr:BAX inhibitor (BI)-1/YccA family protein [Fusobacterium mortiferum]
MSYNDYFGKNVTNISTEVSNTFVRKVMLNMIGGLLVTTLVPIYVFFINQGLMYTLAKYLNIVALGEIVLVFVLTLGLKKMSSGTARLLFY